MGFWQRRYSEVKGFFKAVFSSTDATSSKRVIGFSSFGCMFISEIAFYFLKDHPVIPQFMWWGFVAIVSAAFTLGVIETIIALKTKSKLANNILDKDSSSESSDNAKEVLQGNKP